MGIDEDFSITNDDDDIQMDIDSDADLNMDIYDVLPLDDSEPMNNLESISEGLSMNNTDGQSSWEIVDDEILDTWTYDVNETDIGIVYEQEKIVSIIRKCRMLILMIKRSTVISSFFNTEKQKFNIKRNLCLDVKSRWNSTFHMIDSFLVLRQIIEKLFNSKHNLHLESKKITKLSNLEMSIDDWIMLSALRSVLKPFYNATQALSGQKYPSIGMAYYLINGLKHFLQISDRKENTFAKRLKQILFSKFQFYFDNHGDQIQLLKVENTFSFCLVYNLTYSTKGFSPT